VNESEKSEGYLAIIINANGIFQNKVKKRNLENTIFEEEERKRSNISISYMSSIWHNG
jgi:hypothetical protein